MERPYSAPLRRSTRSTAGLPATRYGQWDTRSHSSSSAPSGSIAGESVSSFRSTTRRQRLAEASRQKRAADAELRRKELAILRMELEVERDLQDCAHEEALAQIEQDATTDFPSAPLAQLDPGQPEDNLHDRIHEWLGDGSTAGAQLHRDDQPGLDEQSAPPATGELSNNPVQPPSQHAMLDAAMLLPLPDGDDSIADSTRYVSSTHVHIQPDQHHTPMQHHVQPPPPTSSSIVNLETVTSHRGLTAVTHAPTAPLSMPHPTQAISVTAAHHVATSTASRSSLPVVSPSTHVPVQHFHVHAPHGSSFSGQRISHSAQSAQPPASTTTNGPRVRLAPTASSSHRPHAPTASSSHHAHAPPVWTTSQPAQQPSARELSLLEEVRHLQDRLARAHVDQPPTSTGGPTIAQSLQQLSATLSAAITRPSDTTHLDKLLARQGTDKALPPFSGAPEEWPVFQQLYMTTTAACGYTDAENLARLQKCLKGKAKTLVQSLLALPANVPRILSTLQMHYGRTDLIIETLIQQVQTLPPVEETNLIDFAVAVQNLVSTIESANATAHLQNPQLRKDLVGRLPPSLRLQWGEKLAEAGPDNMNLANFSTWLTSKATALSYVMSTRPTTGTSPSSLPRHSTSEALLATSTPQVAHRHSSTRQQQQKKPQRKCTYCGQQHWSDECRTYASLVDRRNRLHALGKCTICLRQGHTKKDCRSTRTCFYCKTKGKHTYSLCPQQHRTAGSTNAQQCASDATPATTKRSPQDAQPSPTEPASLVSTHEEVVMQTATATVSNPAAATSGVVRILFDTGSYRTYVTTKLAEKLHLTPKSTEQLSLTTFGRDEVQHIQANTADLAIHLLNGQRRVITATIVPTITGAVPRTSLPRNILNGTLRGLQLADDYSSCTGSADIDILLGNDHYHDLVQPQRRQLSPSLYLLDTHLGWMVSGRLPTTTSHALPDPPPADPSLLILSAPSAPAPPPLDDFWRMETIGIEDSPYDSDDMVAQNLFDKSVTFQDGRYEVGWPWKPHHDLPDNYSLAKGRLTTLLRRFRRDPATLQQYNSRPAPVQRQSWNHRARPHGTRVATATHRRHYLPHHGGRFPFACTTTKLRIVYDGSAKTKATNNSLNDCLYRGPAPAPGSGRHPPPLPVSNESP